MAKKKILILTVPVGGGHTATARVLSENFERRYGKDYEIIFLDVFEAIPLLLPVDKMAVGGYGLSVKTLNSYPYRLFFNFAHANPRFVNEFFITIFRSGGMKMMREIDPDIIVSTFPIISYTCNRLIKEGWHKEVPIISVVTDAGDVHKLWLMGVEDALLVSTPETKEYAIEKGVPAEKIHYLGFPVGEAFSRLPSKHDARQKLNLPDATTVVFTSGGLGLSPRKFIQVARDLAKQQLPGQLVFICGKNYNLYEQLSDIDYLTPTRVEGYVSNMPDYMAAADLVVGKAGWISLYEAMVAQRPTIILDVVPGQEEPNAAFVEMHGVGRVLKDPHDAAAAIAEYLRHPETLEAYQVGFAKLGIDPHAADKITDFVISEFA